MTHAQARIQAAAAADSNHRTRTRLSEILFWAVAIVLACVVPLFFVLAAVFVSSWGIPLPFYVAIP
jgi:ABC-type Fe3+ transport system permease subunit